MHVKKFILLFCAVVGITGFLQTPIVSFAAQGREGGIMEVQQTNAVNEHGFVACAIKASVIVEEPAPKSEILNVVLKNQVIRVVDEDKDYYMVEYGGKPAYVRKENFIVGDKLVSYVKGHPEWFVQKVVVGAEGTNLIDVQNGTIALTAEEGDAFQLKEDDGDFFVVILDEVYSDGSDNSRLARIYKGEAEIKYQVAVTNFEQYQVVGEEKTDLTSFACGFVGCPYVWGGTDPVKGIDCSGFVQYVFRQFGMELPRCSWEQAGVGQPVSFENLQPGDLVFYRRGDRIGHVALYVGDGKIVHARGRNYGVCITDYDYSTPACAMRVLE